MKLISKKSVISLLLCLLWVFNTLAQSASGPESILAKAVASISNAKGVEATFTVYNSGYSGGGRIETSGNKFKVSMPDVSVWYNGKDMYTYNENTGETTVVTPTADELAESNPLAYVTNAAKTYKVAYSTVKKQGRYVLELTPKVKNNEIKRITLTLRANDYVPEKIVVEPVSGNPVSADIKSFKAGVSLAPSLFEYPKNKYPKAEIIDLR